jgi:hypothetical protein
MDMVFSIISLVALVTVMWGLTYLIRTSDRRIDLIEEQRERDYLWFTTRG